MWNRPVWKPTSTLKNKHIQRDDSRALPLEVPLPLQPVDALAGIYYHGALVILSLLHRPIHLV